jgi:DNA-binding NarL/FixJ family response regulator
MTRCDPIRLLLVDARPLIRSAIRCLLQARPDVFVAGDAGTLPHALALASQERPDIVLLTPRADSDVGVPAIPVLLSAAGPQARVLLIADATDAELHRQAIRQGAHGCVCTDRPVETLVKAIEKVHQGEVWMERRLVADVLGTADPAATGERARIESLTRREREVVNLLCQGLRNKEIAQRLTVTDVTVRHHLTSVFSKLGVNDRLGLLIFASRHGLTPAMDRVPQRHL